MVLCVETPYTEVGYGGLQIEDMVVVTEEGYRPLTHGEAIAGGPMSAQTLMRLRMHALRRAGRFGQLSRRLS